MDSPQVLDLERGTVVGAAEHSLAVTATSFDPGGTFDEVVISSEATVTFKMSWGTGSGHAAPGALAGITTDPIYTVSPDNAVRIRVPGDPNHLKFIGSAAQDVAITVIRR